MIGHLGLAGCSRYQKFPLSLYKRLFIQKNKIALDVFFNSIKAYVQSTILFMSKLFINKFSFHNSILCGGIKNCEDKVP